MDLPGPAIAADNDNVNAYAFCVDLQGSGSSQGRDDRLLRRPVVRGGDGIDSLAPSSRHGSPARSTPRTGWWPGPGQVGARGPRLRRQLVRPRRRQPDGPGREPAGVRTDAGTQAVDRPRVRHPARHRQVPRILDGPVIFADPPFRATRRRCWDGRLPSAGHHDAGWMAHSLSGLLPGAMGRIRRGTPVRFHRDGDRPPAAARSSARTPRCSSWSSSRPTQLSPAQAGELGRRLLARSQQQRHARWVRRRGAARGRRARAGSASRSRRGPRRTSRGARPSRRSRRARRRRPARRGRGSTRRGCRRRSRSPEAAQRVGVPRDHPHRVPRQPARPDVLAHPPAARVERQHDGAVGVGRERRRAAEGGEQQRVLRASARAACGSRPTRPDVAVPRPQRPRRWANSTR